MVCGWFPKPCLYDQFLVHKSDQGAGWDRAGELTSDLWPGKAAGVESKTTKTN